MEHKFLVFRAEKEGKALRAELRPLQDEATSLRARLACVQGRRQAEHEQAKRKIEVGAMRLQLEGREKCLGYVPVTVRIASLWGVKNQRSVHSQPSVIANMLNVKNERSIHSPPFESLERSHSCGSVVNRG